MRRTAPTSPTRALTVLEGRALSDFDNVAVGIADVAARLAVLGDRLRDELRTAALPQFITGLNIRNADIHKAVDVIRVRCAERDSRFVRGRPATNVDKEPRVLDMYVAVRALFVALAQRI